MLTEEEKRAIDEAAEALYYVTTDKNGIHHIDLYADYMDTNEGLLQLAYNHRSGADDSSRLEEGTNRETHVLDLLKEQISDWYNDTIRQMEDDIIRRAGYSLTDDKTEAFREYLWENYDFSVPYDHFLNQHMHVNLMLEAGDEVNRDFIAIHELREALTGQLEPEDIESTLQEKTALSWLIEQQGYTMADLAVTMQAYNDYFYAQEENKDLSYSARLSEFQKSHSRFLTSVCEELDNMTNYMNTLTILADVSMYDYCALLEPDKELVLPKDTMLGVFSPWMGGGSTLDIDLEKELVLPSDLIWDIQVEDARLQNQYSVDSVYGLIGRCWKEPLAIRDTKTRQTEKPDLDSVIQNADARKNDPVSGKENKFQDPER